MNKKMRLFKMVAGICLQVLMAVVFAFTEIQVSPYIYLLAWCACAKMLLSAVSFECAR